MSGLFVAKQLGRLSIDNSPKGDSVAVQDGPPSVEQLIQKEQGCVLQHSEDVRSISKFKGFRDNCCKY